MARRDTVRQDSLLPFRRRARYQQIVRIVRWPLLLAILLVIGAVLWLNSSAGPAVQKNSSICIALPTGTVRAMLSLTAEVYSQMAVINIRNDE
jgi:hypothetical protein